MTIALVVPTRARPTQALRLYRSAVTLAKKPQELHFYFGVNEDDETAEELLTYLSAAYKAEPHAPWSVKGYAKGVLGREIWNDLAAHAVAENFDTIWAGSDDIIFEERHGENRVPQWDHVLSVIDQQATKVWPDRNYMVWGWDGSCGARHATHPFVTREWLKTVGYMMPRCCQHFDGDTFLTELAKGARRGVYTEAIVTMHHNPKYGKAYADDTWTRMRPVQRQDYEVYRGPLGQDEVKQALERLKNATRHQSSESAEVAPVGPNVPSGPAAAE